MEKCDRPKDRLRGFPLFTALQDNTLQTRAFISQPRTVKMNLLPQAYMPRGQTESAPAKPQFAPAYLTSSACPARLPRNFLYSRWTKSTQIRQTLPFYIVDHEICQGLFGRICGRHRRGSWTRRTPEGPREPIRILTCIVPRIASLATWTAHGDEHAPRIVSDEIRP
jgi:hypothetical protein